VSLLFALIANLTLLLNMARRLSFRVAQPITIWGFWIASILLISLIAVASNHTKFHQPGVKNQALSQAYYYATFAAGLYQIISYLVSHTKGEYVKSTDPTSFKMMFTAYGALKGHYSKKFKLTIPQRTLMLHTICFLFYLLLGALVYSKIEGWKFLDAVYWADFTLLTIGIGNDYTPHTHLGRSLLFPFAIGGIVYLGLIVGSIRSLVLDRTKKRLGARITEKVRRRVIKRVEKAEHSSNPINKIRGLDKMMAKCLALDPRDYAEGEKRRREAEFHAMRAVQEMAAKERRWIGLTVSGLSWLFLVSFSNTSPLRLFPRHLHSTRQSNLDHPCMLPRDLYAKSAHSSPQHSKTSSGRSQYAKRITNKSSLVDHRCSRILEGREKSALDLLRIRLLLLHFAFDNRVWRLPTHKQ
jgi:potassium channel subfamily K